MESTDIVADPDVAEQYAISAPLGAGGFAKVFRARQKTTGQEVAIKILELERGTSAPADHVQLERFRREARFCAELHHPNIVPLIDSGETNDGRVYTVFALVPGRDLGSVLAAEGALEPVEALHLMMQVIDAISCAHAKGIVHRDLKPGNIMVSSAGARRNALVFDFGIGAVASEKPLLDMRRITERGEYLGTPLYSAPEQLRGDPPSVLSDLYAWGLIFLECLTGEPAIGALRPYEVIHRQLNPDPIPIPAVLRDHALGELLRQVTSKDVEKRRITADEILQRLLLVAQTGLPTRQSMVEMRAPGEAALRGSTMVSRPPPSRLSPGWLVPLRRNTNFAGREALLTRLFEGLRAPKPVAVVVLHGLGGIGKTQLALEHAYRRAEDYRLVTWIRAEEPETLETDYAAMAKALNLPETPNQRQRIENVRAWLEQHDRWLLVFDNAPNPAAIRQYLPRSHGGHIIVTSRHQSWRDLGTGITVDVLERTDSIEFLVRRTGDANREAAAELSDELGRLPLALEEAAAYIETTGRSLASYLPLLRNHRERILFGQPSTPDHRGTLRTTWELSFQEVERESPAASDLLKLCAFLAPDDVPFALLQRGSIGLPAPLGEEVADELALDGCVAALRRYALVNVEADSLSVHRLVQLATRERLSPTENRRWKTLALEMMESVYPRKAIAGAYYPESGRLFPHALAALSHAMPNPEQPDVAARMLRRTGIYLSARGVHDKACDSLEGALAMFEKAREVDQSQVGGTLWELGMVLYALGEAEKAKEHLERGLTLLEKDTRPAGRVIHTQTLVALSWVQRSLGDFPGALGRAEEALAFAKEIGAENHPLESTCLGLLARAHWSLGHVEKARESVEKALVVLRATKEPQHPLNCGTWYLVAQVSLDVGELDRARAAAERGLSVGEDAYGRDHPLVCLNLCVQGAVALRRDDLKSARRCFERALDSGQRACLHLHEDIAAARGELALVLLRENDIEGARAQLFHTLDNVSRLCGDTARVEGEARVRLGSLYRGQGDLASARRECETALQLLDARYGAAHPLRIGALNALGWTLLDLGKAKDAAARFEEAIAITAAHGLDALPERRESDDGLLRAAGAK